MALLREVYSKLLVLAVYEADVMNTISNLRIRIY